MVKSRIEKPQSGLIAENSAAECGEKQFDLIFMDIHMPVMDGIEAAQKIFALTAAAGVKVPVIAMTANIMPNDRETYLSSGMVDCIGKPFTSQELWHCLMKYLTPLAGQKNTHGNFATQGLPEETLIISPPESDDSSELEDLDKEFQKAIIREFINSNSNKFKEITSALDINDIKSAHRLAHSLKGNAGFLGKTSLQKAAEIVESRLKDEKNLVTREELDMLESELNAVLEQISFNFNN